MPALRYKGTAPRSEASITGRGRIWHPGESGFVTSARATQLLAAAQGWETADTQLVPRTIRVAHLIGTKAAPLASHTGATSGQMTLKTPILVPANTMEIGSVLRVRALIDRVGANATGAQGIRFGTANAVGDSLVSNVTMGATDGLGLRVEVVAIAQSATGYLQTSGAQLNTTISGGFTEISGGNCNIAADQYVTFHMASANASDEFRLLAVSVDVEL